MLLSSANYPRWEVWQGCLRGQPSGQRGRGRGQDSPWSTWGLFCTWGSFPNFLPVFFSQAWMVPAISLLKLWHLMEKLGIPPKCRIKLSSRCRPRYYSRGQCGQQPGVAGPRLAPVEGSRSASVGGWIPARSGAHTAAGDWYPRDWYPWDWYPRDWYPRDRYPVESRFPGSKGI